MNYYHPETGITYTEEYLKYLFEKIKNIGTFADWLQNELNNGILKKVSD